MLNDNNVKKINKIRAVRSLKYYNEKYKNRMISKINGTYKRKNKNLFDKDRPTNPDAAR